MGDLQKNENKKKRPVVRYLLYLLVVVTIIAGAVPTLAKYATSVSGTDTARAAKFDYELNVSRNALDKITNPSDGLIAFNANTLNTTTTNDTKQVEFLVSLYATSMLADAGNCKFDEVARVIDVTFTNTSEVTVNAIIQSIDDIATGNGIVWCLFNEGDNYTGYGDILTKLGYTTSTVPTYSTLIADLNTANAATLAAWNAAATLAPNGSKTLTIVFWAEHEAVADSGWNFDGSSPLEQSIDIDYKVTQVD